MNGFLGTGAPLHADINLVLQLLMGVSLLIGKLLARAKKYKTHQICQMSVVLFNLVLILSIMDPSFRRTVVPNAGKVTSDFYYGLAALHATLGTIAELLALYVILVAGTSWIPERFRFKVWRHWMGATLALWWVVILLGVGLYSKWYVFDQGGAHRTVTEATSDTLAVVTVANFQFNPKAITVRAGTTVAWADTLGRHIIALDNGSFTSEDLLTGHQVTHKFTTPGTYLYHCQLHGAPGGGGMAGAVVVTPR